MDFLYLCPPIKCEANYALNSLKVLMEFGVNLLNHILAGPFNVVGKARHMISSTTPCKCIKVLKDFRWSKRSLDPLKASTYGMRNFGRRRNKVTDAVNGESVWQTNSSRSLDTRPLRAFILKSIRSFIICISATMYGGAVSAVDGRLVSCCSGLLGALLPSGPSWSLLSALVPSYSSPWLLGLASFWRGCSSRSWFCLVRRSTVMAKVCICLSRVVVCGSSPIWLFVAIERVSTIQLFV